MSIKAYEENGEKVYQVYVNGFDSAGRRIQKRKLKVETLKKAQDIEFELKRELAKLKEQAVPYRWDEWLIWQGLPFNVEQRALEILAIAPEPLKDTRKTLEELRAYANSISEQAKNTP